MYGLSIKENFKVLHSYQFDSKDYQITPGSLWNYAIQLSSPYPENDMEVIVDGLKPPFPPFSQQGAPIKIQAKVGWFSVTIASYLVTASLFLGTCVRYMGIAAQCSSSTSISCQVHQSTGNNHIDSLWSN